MFTPDDMLSWLLLVTAVVIPSSYIQLQQQ
jgi:hypothetical protein